MRTSVCVDGHSAGGTNPSLVEVIHFGVPVLAYGCAFNRHSTEDRGRCFRTPEELATLVQLLTQDAAMQEVARRRYTWDHIGEACFALLEDNQPKM